VCPFYGVPAYDSCHRIAGQCRCFCVIEVFCSETLYNVFLSSLFALVFFLEGSLSRLLQMIIFRALPLINHRSVLILLTVKSLLNIKLFKIKMKILKIITSEIQTLVCVWNVIPVYFSVFNLLWLLSEVINTLFLCLCS